MIARLIASTVILGTVLAGVSAQQMEPNSPGGSLTRFGASPTPGSPFLVGRDGQIDFEISGLPSVGVLLILGDLATNSTFVPVLANQFFDLSLGTAFLVGDGINGAGALPPAFFITNSQGSASYSIPVNPVVVGQAFAFQAFVLDPALPPLNLNLTAAAEFVVLDGVVLSGDGIGNFDLSAPVNFYGNAYSEIDLSSTGWIRFGGGATTTDPLTAAGAFENGNVGGNATGAPIVAPYWTSSVYNAAIGGMIIATETSPSVITVDYMNPLDSSGQSFGAGFTCVMDFSMSAPVIQFDYTQLIVPPLVPFSISGTLIGISDGGTAGANAHMVDLVANGSVVPFGPTGAAATIYQEFFSLFGGPAALVDVGGLILTFTEAGGIGDFQLN